MDQNVLRKYKLNLPARQNAFLLLALMITLLFAYLAYTQLSAGFTDWSLRRQLGSTATVEATILEKWNYGGGDDLNCSIGSCFVKYSFDALLPDETRAAFTRDGRVSQSVYTSVKVGDAISVVYNRSDPTISMPEVVLNDQFLPAAPLLCGTGFLLAALLALGMMILARSYNVIALLIDFQRNPQAFRRKS